MNVGNELMDGEHAAQQRYMDAFERALREGPGIGDGSIALERLVRFTSLHFMSEQVLMQQSAYPGAAAHGQEHERLLAQVQQIQKAFDQGDQTMTEQELATLRQWLVDHIRTVDAAFARYLTERNG
jgi:hemerythrin-like metal-binding protein